MQRQTVDTSSASVFYIIDKWKSFIQNKTAAKQVHTIYQCQSLPIGYSKAFAIKRDGYFFGRMVPDRGNIC